MIENICLNDDSLSSVQHFYDSINTSIMITLTSNKFLPEYEALSPNFNCETYILLPPVHTQYHDAKNIYKNMSKILLFHLQNSKTINNRYAPKATLLRHENLHEKCVFKLFIKLISKLSPQLGGPAFDLEEYVKTLKISDGEPFLEFYTGVLIMSNETLMC